MPQVISLFQGKSFQEQFPGIRVRYDMNCFVKMQCYSLAIPADTRSWKEIDIFSDTVLRLIALDRDLTTGQIAERMCVGKDFVQFIFIRLREARLIDDRNKLTERGRHQTQQSFAEQRADLDAEPLMAYAFALPGTQEYLSYLRVGELMAEQATENRDNGRCWIEFETGSAGREKTIRGQLLRIRENGRQPLRYSALPPVIFNGLIIGAELCWCIMGQWNWGVFIAQGVSVAAGEAVACVLGVLLVHYVETTPRLLAIFRG